MTRGPRRIALLVLAAASAAAAEEELTLEQLAAMEREEQAAIDRVSAAHGNQPPHELSLEERAEIAHQQQEASREVFEKYGVDPKEYVGRTARLTPEEIDRVNAEKKRLDEEEKERLAREAAARADPPAPAPEDVEVVRGINEAKPVEVYREEDGPVEVENLAEIAGESAQEEAPARKEAPRPKNRRRR